MGMPNKAPAGGMVSAVNGQWYEGGEFMPDHGKFCGKGKNRITVAEFNAVAKRVSDAGKILVYDENTGDFIVKYPTGNNMFRVRSLATIAKAF